jgi:hypothetical protein
MRDEAAQFRPGKKASTDSLEFVGGKKKSLFAQYTAQFQQKTEGAASSRVEPIKHVTSTPNFKVRQSVTYQDMPYVVEEPTDLPLPTDVDNFLQEDDEALKGLKQSKIQKVHLGDADDVPQPDKKMSKLAVVTSTVAVVCGIGIIAISVQYIRGMQSIVPSSLRSAVAFPVYEVVNNPTFKVDRSTVAKGANDSLVYVAEQRGSDAKFIISQQAVPEVLKADAQFSSFLSQTDKFATLDTKIGKAYFTKPANIGDDISVVVKTNTTLLFIRGSGATSEDKWAALLASLAVDK